MAETTKIEWTDATWNPVTGCSVVSPGCANCYAMRLAGTRLKHHPSRAGLTTDSRAGPVWTGETRLNEAWLDQPLRWRRPRRVFVCAHGDLFHESVPDEWIDRVFAVMALSPQHSFQVLTKRAERMRAYLTSGRATSVGMAALELTLAAHFRDRRSRVGAGVVLTGDIPHLKVWPLPNVWLGVSVEDHARADARIPVLLDTPAALRFVSAEPLLGPVDLTNLDPTGIQKRMNAHGWSAIWKNNGIGRPWLDWVIVGGESGTGARPMYPDWARSLRDQCEDAGVPFFFKQWGEWAPEAMALRRCWSDHDTYAWPEGDCISVRIGKKYTGALLDGREHRAFPS